MKEYSLWLIPPEDVGTKFSNLISQLSKKYETFPFEPHVTLIGGVSGTEEDILSKTSQLAKVIKPYEIEFGTVEYLNEFFRCLFIRVKETDGVMNANLKAREIFGHQRDPKYMPHLSLVYGDIKPKTKEKIITDIGNRFDVKFEVQRVGLFMTDGRDHTKWYRVKEFVLRE